MSQTKKLSVSSVVLTLSLAAILLMIVVLWMVAHRWLSPELWVGLVIVAYLSAILCELGEIKRKFGEQVLISAEPAQTVDAEHIGRQALRGLRSLAQKQFGNRARWLEIE